MSPNYKRKASFVKAKKQLKKQLFRSVFSAISGSASGGNYETREIHEMD